MGFEVRAAHCRCMDTQSASQPPEGAVHKVIRYGVKAVSLVVAVPMMFIAPRTTEAVLTSIDHRTDAPDLVKRRREGEAKMRLLQAMMNPEAWEDLSIHMSARAGRVLEDWLAAEAFINELDALPPAKRQSRLAEYTERRATRFQAGPNMKCGRCSKPLSPVWTRCEHCKASYGEFAPVARG